MHGMHELLGFIYDHKYSSASEYLSTFNFFRSKLVKFDFKLNKNDTVLDIDTKMVLLENSF